MFACVCSCILIYSNKFCFLDFLSISSLVSTQTHRIASHQTSQMARAIVVTCCGRVSEGNSCTSTICLESATAVGWLLPCTVAFGVAAAADDDVAVTWWKWRERPRNWRNCSGRDTYCWRIAASLCMSHNKQTKENEEMISASISIPLHSAFTHSFSLAVSELLEGKIR